MMAEAQTLISAASGILAIAAMVYAWLTSRSSKNAEEIKHLRELSQSLAARVQTVEQDIRHIPTKDAVHMLELSIAEIKGDIHAMSETFAAVQRTAQRIENFLLHEAKK